MVDFYKGDKNIDFKLKDLEVVENFQIWIGFGQQLSDQEMITQYGVVLQFPVREGALQGTDRVIFKTNTSGASWWFADDYDWKLIELKKIECPECDKIVAVQEKSQEIGDFIEWLGNKKDLHLCFWENQYNYRMNTTIEKLLAEYFEIDLEKVENEKQAILDELRKKP